MQVHIFRIKQRMQQFLVINAYSHLFFVHLKLSESGKTLLIP